MGHLYTPARPKIILPDPLPQPLVPHIVKLADEIDEKKLELNRLLRAAELDEMRRCEHFERIEYGRLGGSIKLPPMPEFNEEED